MILRKDTEICLGNMMITRKIGPYKNIAYHYLHLTQMSIESRRTADSDNSRD